jgi:hypothetical protein
VHFNFLGKKKKKWLGPGFVFLERLMGSPGVNWLWLVKRGLTGWLRNQEKSATSH